MIIDMSYYIVCVFFLCFVRAIPLNYSNYKPAIKVDPDFYRNVSQLITSKGYPVEEYWVQTEDGYILGVQRIPRGRSDPEPSPKTRPVVFLQHGLLSSSADWVMNFPHESLGFILADAGYDVWLGNQRGNTYSRKHVKYSPRDKEFWQFSFDEFAEYDLPAMMEFALNVTNQSQLYYVGHSEGTTVAFALLSERPDYDKIKVVVALGPVATVGYITSPIRYLAPFAPILDPLFRLFGFYEFLPNDLIMKLLARFICGNRELQFLCENVAFLISGFDPSELNKTRLEVYATNFPAGTSTQNVVHFAQMVNSKNFQMYDYGKTENMKKYNKTTPPEYNVENIRTPVALFYALNDFLADPVDVALLRMKLKNLVECYRVSLPTWAHIDFVIGMDAPGYVYQEVMRIMRKHATVIVVKKTDGITWLNMIIDMSYYIVCVFFLCFVRAIPLNYSNYKPAIKVDPDFYRNVSQLITSKGYPVEEYWVQTEDGYILGVQRIPRGRSDPEPSLKTRPVVFLQHGLLSSSADWVMNFPNESLGFILADAGYDVWLGNQRGNTYSRKHVKYSPRDKEFWQFSFDEFAEYDLPAMMEFALNVTNQSQLYYVGHSEGTTVAFALLSERPDYDKIKVVVALGPVATVGYITSPIRYLAPFAPILDPLFRLFGFYEFLPNDLIMKLLARFICGNRELQFLCENVAFLISGFDPSELNKTRLEVYATNFPAGTSTQNVVHFAQMVNSKNFQMYDYGKTENMKKYNKTTPPEYNVENIRTPVALFYALNDFLADPVDVALLRMKLKNLVECYRVSLPTWAHIDFVIGMDAPGYVYQEVMRIMRKV
ncbi:uncharacterized protein LOC111625178 [Centruroides sculpturatus]|uniref:uncharacterized protein LOC111625178 n=1 Tax=Centruroides sculpturatus TaxID=218467 RepID=UPI000C6EB5C6|nr:uncharacterized protein LOC111625178 [Centruroides sculpturatus]